MDKKQTFICSRCGKEFTKDEIPVGALFRSALMYGHYSPGNKYIFCKECYCEWGKLIIRQEQERKEFLGVKQED